MLLLAGIISLVSIFEIAQMRRKKQVKEIIVFILFAAFALAFGMFCILNPYKNSLSFHVLNLLGFYK